MLTPYDEFPVHQHSRPFSVVPVTDPAWDDGYFFGVYSAEEKLFLYMGMRINTNTDMVGGYAGIMLDGVQHTLRLSRIWRPHFEVAIGPLTFNFVEPMKRVMLRLGANDSDLTFDLEWIAIAPAHEEEHHLASEGERVTTDQTRYSQTGTARGTITFKGHTWVVEPGRWYGDRDHSWGLYRQREPLRIPAKYLPPRKLPAARRALRFWMPFSTPDYSGFYHFHEDEHGHQVKMNDVFGSAFEGRIDYGFSGRSLRFVSAQHQLKFVPGTRAVSSGVVDLVDEQGRAWRHEIYVATSPWQSFMIGYNGGSWRDGGNIGSYHGSGIYQECDEFDLAIQPFDLDDYLGRPRTRYGNEYVVRVRSTGPDGISEGLGHLETFIDGTYRRYGFVNDGNAGASYSQP
jgi:hypothetical protein